jgi:hypothetical protein
MKIKRNVLLAIAAVFALGWMIKDSFTQPGLRDLGGDFKELDFVRNEQNTGPIIRVYAVSLNDTLWSVMETYGDYLPHTKYGTTSVYFFLNGQPAPTSLSIDNGHIENRYKDYCIAKFEKNAMGQTFLRKYPFSK